MDTPTQALSSGIAAFEASLKRNTAINVNSSRIKSSAIELGAAYFREYRPAIVKILGESDLLLQFDKEWHQLIRLAQSNNKLNAYKRCIRALKDYLRELSVSELSHGGVSKEVEPGYSEQEKQIISTLRETVLTAADSYQQGIDDLKGKTRRSYRGTATDLREALRETLNHFAPDSEVEKQPWYKREKDQTKPTMKQKMEYVLRSRQQHKDARVGSEKSVTLVEELVGQITRAVYTRASISTHLATTQDEVKRVKRYVDTLLCELLELG